MKAIKITIFICICIMYSYASHSSQVNIYTWKGVEIATPMDFMLQDKDNIAIISNEEKNPRSFLVIYESNSTSENILQNLRKKNTTIEIQSVESTNIAGFSCTRINGVYIADRKLHITYIINDHAIKVIYNGSINDFDMYQRIIESLKFKNQ